MAKCHGKTRTGEACKMPAQRGGRYCFTHSPATRRAQAEARKKGGRNRKTPHGRGDVDVIPEQITTVKHIETLLDYIRHELLVMENGIPRARALLALAEIYFRALEVGQYEERIRALEERK